MKTGPYTPLEPRVQKALSDMEIDLKSLLRNGDLEWSWAKKTHAVVNMLDDLGAQIKDVVHRHAFGAINSGLMHGGGSPLPSNALDEMASHVTPNVLSDMVRLGSDGKDRAGFLVLANWPGAETFVNYFINPRSMEQIKSELDELFMLSLTPPKDISSLPFAFKLTVKKNLLKSPFGDHVTISLRRDAYPMLNNLTSPYFLPELNQLFDQSIPKVTPTQAFDRQNPLGFAFGLLTALVNAHDEFLIRHQHFDSKTPLDGINAYRSVMRQVFFRPSLMNFGEMNLGRLNLHAALVNPKDQKKWNKFLPEAKKTMIGDHMIEEFTGIRKTSEEKSHPWQSRSDVATKVIDLLLKPRTDALFEQAFWVDLNHPPQTDYAKFQPLALIEHHAESARDKPMSFLMNGSWHGAAIDQFNLTQSIPEIPSLTDRHLITLIHKNTPDAIRRWCYVTDLADKVVNGFEQHVAHWQKENSVGVKNNEDQQEKQEKQEKQDSPNPLSKSLIAQHRNDHSDLVFEPYYNADALARQRPSFDNLLFSSKPTKTQKP